MIKKMIAAFLIQLTALAGIIAIPVRQKSMVEKYGEIYELRVTDAYVDESVDNNGKPEGYVFRAFVESGESGLRKECWDFEGNASLNRNKYSDVSSGMCSYRFRDQNIGKYVKSCFEGFVWGDSVSPTEKFLKEHDVVSTVKIFGNRMIFVDLYIDGIQIEQFFG